jgi:hypothetical protein
LTQLLTRITILFIGSDEDTDNEEAPSDSDNEAEASTTPNLHF